MAAPSPSHRRARITTVVSQLIDLLEQHGEFRRAYDRLGDRQYLATRRKLVDTFLEFAREVVRATRKQNDGSTRG